MKDRNQNYTSDRKPRSFRARRVYDSQTHINRVRRILIDTIKCQTGLNISQDANRFFNGFDKMVKDNGIRFATLRYKEIYHCSLNNLLNQTNPNYSYLKTTRGFPRVVLYLKKHASTPQGKQAILSLLGYYRCIIAPGIPDFSKITKSGIEVPEQLLAALSNFTKEHHPKMKFNVSKIGPPRIELRTKRGPNGQATLTCMLDLAALTDSLYDSIIHISEAQHGDDFVETIEELRDYAVELEVPEAKHSRLAIKREGGGKDRVFAIVDFWTQACLSALHSKLAGILRTIDQDCTWNQSKGVPTIKSWTKDRNDLYSFDLSSATDRFPVSIQERILQVLTTDIEYSRNWRNLMTNRDFHYKGNTYKWAVGQPLGAHSSWPMFALSHHIVVQYCAHKAKVDPTYYLLGDDIVIAGKKLADEYQNLLVTIGVDISWSKSISGCQAEFAKRVFYKGYEITPAPVKMLQSLLRDPILIGEACSHLLEKASETSSFEALRCSAVKAFTSLTRWKDKDELLVIASNPITGWKSDKKDLYHQQSPYSTYGNSGCMWSVFDREIYLGLYSIIKYKYLMKQYQQLAAKAQSNVYQYFETQNRKLELPGTTPVSSKLHPILTAFRLQNLHFKEAHREIGKYWSSLKTGVSSLSNLESIPVLKSFSVETLTRSHRSRIKHNARIILDLYNASKALYESVEKTGEHHVLTLGEAIKLTLRHYEVTTHVRPTTSASADKSNVSSTITH